jgi:hypothetical protein
MNGTDRVTRWGATAATLTVAGVAAVISYRHAAELATSHWEGGDAHIWPLTVDGLIAASSLVLLADARAGRRSHWLVRAGLVLGIVVTVAVNGLHGWPHGLLAAAISSWPAVALIITFEVLMIGVRAARPVPAAVPVAANGHKPLPSVRELRDREHVSQATAYKIRRALRTYGTPPSGGRDASLPQPVLATLNGERP